MKKILLFGGALALLFSDYASCMTDKDTQTRKKVETGCCKKGKDAHAGFAVAVGVTAGQDLSKSTIIQDRWEGRDLHADYGLNVPGVLNPTTDVLRSDFRQTNNIDVDGDLTLTSSVNAAGNDELNSFDARHVHFRELSKHKSGKFGGRLAAYYFRFITGNFCLGFAAQVDLAGNSTKTNATDRLHDAGRVETKTRGLRPGIYLLFGGYIPGLDILACLKTGTALVHSELKNDQSSIKINGLTPTVGAMVKKSLGKNLSFIVDFDYFLQKTKEGDLNQRPTVDLGANAAGATTPCTVTHYTKIKHVFKKYQFGASLAINL